MAALAIEGLAFSEEKKKYIVDVLDPVLEEMVMELLMETPVNTTQYMIQWLRKRHGGPIKAPMGMRELNAKLKNELAGMNEFMAGAVSAVNEGKPKTAEEDSDEDEDDDEIDEPIPPPTKSRGPRASVSAEAYGAWNKVKAFTPPKYEKSEAQIEQLRKILCNSFLFSNLDDKDMDVVLMAMVDKTFPAGSRIITEGDDGHHLYVIEAGSPVCKKMIDGENKIVKTCTPGDVFGELALLYNNPRAATVEAVDTCKCWELDRETFSHIVKDAATKRAEQNEGFLQKVKLFATMEKYERSQVCDALKVVRFNQGDYVVKQGEEGNTFYIVEDGELAAIKDMKGEGPKTVMQYKSGDYFGELALLKNQPRAASVQVTSNKSKILSLDRKSFVKMLGPLEDILKRKSDEYK